MANNNHDHLLTSYNTCREKILAKPCSLQQIISLFLNNIAQKKHLNAFVRTYQQDIQAKVQEVTHMLQNNQPPPLAGMAVGIKDLFCYKDHPIQASSKILETFISQINATAVTKLLEAGAIILGHQNCDEFGMGSANEHTIYGPTRNPIDPTLTAGGSSGGSAAAIKAHMCHISLGTDTGGSVRQPAALCGIIGLKPTYGRISRYGVIAYSSSLDTIGILAHNIQDCATTLNIIAGQDTKDTTTLSTPTDDYTALLNKNPAKKLNIAYLKETLEHQSLQPEIKQATQKTLQILTQQGHTITPIDFPLLEYVLPTYYILTTGEASTELARYDGVRYGHRAKDTTSFQEMVRKTRTHGFGKEVKRRLLLGTFVLTSDYYDNYYGQAQKVRQKIKNTMIDIFTHYDYIISPTTPTTAFPLYSTQDNPMLQYLADLYTVPASIAGLPAISIPNGNDNKNLPIGLQIIAPPQQEQHLLQFAQHILNLTGHNNHT